jgi:hypothetical protein
MGQSTRLGEDWINFRRTGPLEGKPLALIHRGAIWSKQRCINAKPFKSHRETFQMKEIKPDQRWSEGVNEVQVTNAFGVRIRIRRSGAQADEEITEDEFRKRFTFVG